MGKQRRKADAHLVGGKNPLLSGNFRPAPGEVLEEILCEVSSVRYLVGTTYPCRQLSGRQPCAWDDAGVKIGTPGWTATSSSDR